MPADLTSLMKLAPLQGAYMTGQQFDQDQQAAFQKMRDLQQLMQQRQQEMDYNQQANPLRLQGESLKNKGLEAGLPGITATSQLKQTEASNAAKTADSTVAATNAENEDKQNKIKFDQVSRAHNALIQMIPELQMVPGPAQRAVFRQHLQDAGMNVESPQLAALDQAAGTPAFGQMLKGITDKLAEQKMALDPAARAHMYAADSAAKASVEHAKITAGATVQAARISADGRLAVANAKKADAENLLLQVKTGKVPPDRALTMGTMNMMLAEQRGDSADAAFWQNFNGTVEHVIKNIQTYKGEGKLTLDEKGNLTPASVKPVFEDKGSKPKVPGSGTAQDPYVLK